MAVMALKIAMIGAGSIGFTRRLMGDLLTVPEFADTTFALTDINAQNLDMVRQLAERDIAGNGLPALQSVHLYNTAVTKGGMAALRLVRPGLKVTN